MLHLICESSAAHCHIGQIDTVGRFVLDDLDEALPLIVDHVIGAEGSNILIVTCACRREHGRAGMLCELDCHATGTAGTRMDQDRLPGF